MLSVPSFVRSSKVRVHIRLSEEIGTVRLQSNLQFPVMFVNKERLTSIHSSRLVDTNPAKFLEARFFWPTSGVPTIDAPREALHLTKRLCEGIHFLFLHLYADAFDFLIGASGFVGTHVVRGLVDRGHEVAVFHSGKATVSFPSDVRTIVGDRDQLREYATTLCEFEPEVVIDVILPSIVAFWPPCPVPRSGPGTAGVLQQAARKAGGLSRGDV